VGFVGEGVDEAFSGEDFEFAGVFDGELGHGRRDSVGVKGRLAECTRPGRAWVGGKRGGPVGWRE
jgi:hypothetical protein